MFKKLLIKSLRAQIESHRFLAPADGRYRQNKVYCMYYIYTDTDVPLLTVWHHFCNNNNGSQFALVQGVPVWVIDSCTLPNSNFSKTFYKYILPTKMLMQISMYLVLVSYFLISRIPNFRLDTPCTDICFQFWQKLFFAHITLIDQWTQKILSCFDFYTRNCSKHRKLLDCWT